MARNGSAQAPGFTFLARVGLTVISSFRSIKNFSGDRDRSAEPKPLARVGRCAVKGMLILAGANPAR